MTCKEEIHNFKSEGKNTYRLLNQVKGINKAKVLSLCTYT